MEMSGIDHLKNHRSIKRFKTQPIPDDIVQELLATGIRAPNAQNLQQYSLIVCTKPEVIEKIAKPTHLRHNAVPLIIISIIDTYRLKKWFDMNNAQNHCLSSVTSLFIPFCDALLALHNISIASESLGLGAYYVGAVLELNIHDIFDCPENTFPVGMLCIGYPDEKRGLSSRLPLESVVHYNKYKKPKKEEMLSYYKIRDSEWEHIPPDQKKEYQSIGIENIAQLFARYQWNKESLKERNNKLISNLKRYGYDFDELNKIF
jgi:nitroreductase